eukprot:scaffold13889_cov178-Amphora_coffeaeformis.AAC.2
MAQSRHPGNVRLHRTVKQYVNHYEAATSRHQKTHIIQLIYHQLRMGGSRFVETEQSTGVCKVASHETSKSKVAHAMRYRLKKAQEARELFSEEELESVLGPEGLLEFDYDGASFSSLEDDVL